MPYLISTNEYVTPLVTSRRAVNAYLARYGTVAGKVVKSQFNVFRIPHGKQMEDGYSYYLMANGTVQLIHKSRTKEQPN